MALRSLIRSPQAGPMPGTTRRPLDPAQCWLYENPQLGLLPSSE